MAVQRDVHAKLIGLYDWLVRTSIDPNGNMIMPWNHTDTAVEYAWMDLLVTPRRELEDCLETATNPMDRLIIERTLEAQSRGAAPPMRP